MLTLKTKEKLLMNVRHAVPSSIENHSTPSDAETSPLTLEFAWKGKSSLGKKEINIVDLYIDEKLRYTIHIPPTDNFDAKTISLPFKKYHEPMTFGSTDTEIHYLIIKNLATAHKITLEVGILTEKEGNVMTRNLDGSFSREIRYRREDISIEANVSSLALGNHYKIILTNVSEPESKSAHPIFDLRTIIERHGPSKVVTPSATLLHPRVPSMRFFDSNPINPQVEALKEEMFKKIREAKP
jgi:hypothetical protein